MSDEAAKPSWYGIYMHNPETENGPIDLKEDLCQCKNYYIVNIHVIGFLPLGEPYVSKRTGRKLLHWRLVVDCKRNEVQNKDDQQKRLIHIENGFVREDVKANNGKYDVPILVEISEEKYIFEESAPQETRFTFPIITNKRITAKAMFALFTEKHYNRYRYDEKAGGCLHWVKCILSDMIALKWFDHSDDVKKSLKKLDSFKKGSEVGTQYYVGYGIGTFEKKRGPPKLEIS